MVHEGMVDALHECWRTLRPAGGLVDARPIGIDRQVEIVANGEFHPAGFVDMSLGLPDDEAANAAMAAVVDEGLFIREIAHSFIFTNYWETVAEARQHVESEWSNFAGVTEATWERATALWRGRSGRVAIRGPVQIVRYRKL